MTYTKAGYTPARPIPAGLQKYYKIINGKGGPQINAIPVRSDGQESATLAAMLPNDTIIVAVDLSLPYDQIKEFYYAPHGWGIFQMPNGSLFTPSPTGMNWCEFKSHLEAIEDEPIPEDDIMEMEVTDINIQFEPEFKMFVKAKVLK